MSHRRKVEDLRRLKKLCEATNGYCVGAYIDNRGVYRRWWPYSSNVNKKKYYRRVTNRRIRKLDDGIILNGGLYKKIFDLWWTLF